MKLIDQMILEHLFQIARSDVTFFVQDVMQVAPPGERRALFNADLVFNAQGIFLKLLHLIENFETACYIVLKCSGPGKNFLNLSFSSGYLRVNRRIN